LFFFVVDVGDDADIVFVVAAVGFLRGAERLP
jgi:hypothetical protein